MPLLTSASAAARTSASLTLSAKKFQLFQPIGGVAATAGVRGGAAPARAAPQPSRPANSSAMRDRRMGASWSVDGTDSGAAGEHLDGLAGCAAQADGVVAAISGAHRPTIQCHFGQLPVGGRAQA